MKIYFSTIHIDPLSNQTWNSKRAMLVEDFQKSAKGFMEKNASESAAELQIKYKTY